MSDSIKVAIKVRPLIKREKDENLSIQWMTQGNTIVATDAELRKRADGGFEFGMKLMCYEINTNANFETRVRDTRYFIYTGPSKNRLSQLHLSIFYSFLISFNYECVSCFTLDTKNACTSRGTIKKVTSFNRVDSNHVGL